MRTLFAFRGRVGRLPFAVFMIVAWGLAYTRWLRILVDTSIHAVDPTFPSGDLLTSAAPMPFGVAVAILSIAGAFAVLLLLGSPSLLARRFHDVDLSAWLVFPAILSPMLVPNVWTTEYLPPLGLVLLIGVMSLVPGTPGRNRYDATSAQADS